MKRSLRVFALLIFFASGISVSAFPLTRTEPSSGLYWGNLNIKIYSILDYAGGSKNVRWEAEHPIFFSFPGPAHAASVVFFSDEYAYVTYSENLNAPGEGCSNITHVATGHTRAGVMPSGGKSSYDPKTNVFVAPYGVNPTPAWNWIFERGGCASDPQGWSSVSCGAECENYFWKPDVSVSKMITTMKINIMQETGNRLYGTCELSLWDEISGGGYQYWTECTWRAQKVPVGEPEWRQKK